MFDYHAEVDDHRDAARRPHVARLAETPVVVETLADVLARGNALPVAAGARPGDDDALALLIYTSGSTGAPKGAMYPRSMVANIVAPVQHGGVGQRRRVPSITLNFMPMSHVMGRGILYGTLGSGGTAYFAAKSDLSTFFEDLALVRPTELSFVPRIWDMLFQRVPERSRPPVGRRRRPRGPSRPTCWPTCARTCSAGGSSRR